MFGFGKSKTIKSTAYIANNFVSMCRTVAGSTEDLSKNHSVRFLGFSCGVTVALCDDANLNLNATDKALLLMFEHSISKKGAKNTLDAARELLHDESFRNAVLVGKSAIADWSGTSGFPVRTGRMLAQLLDTKRDLNSNMHTHS